MRHSTSILLEMLLLGSLAAELPAQSFFPLQLGNRWTFDYYYLGSIYDPSDNQTDTVTISVTADTLQIDGRTYFTLASDAGYAWNWVSNDSSKIRFRYPLQDFDHMVFDLNAEVGDIFTWTAYPYPMTILDRIDTVLFVGESTTVRTYWYATGLSGQVILQLSEKYGLLRYDDYAGDPPPPWPMVTYSLLGCELSGVKWGFTVGVPHERSIPTSARLLQCYPNPFNPTTTIPFEIEKESQVTISIYNSLGQRVRQLTESRYLAGRHQVQFDALDEHRRQLPSGVYIAVLHSQETSSSTRLILLR